MAPWHDARVMQPPWKLVVDDLGRIGHAEIEARPLLLFVGGNNTGKTYLASLMWGLLSLSGGLPIVRGDAFRRCVAWIEERYARREQEPTFEITAEVHADLVQIVNDTLRDQGAALAERTFNRPGFKVGSIEMREVAQNKWSSLRWEPDERDGRLSARPVASEFELGIVASDASGFIEMWLRLQDMGVLGGIRVRVAPSGMTTGLVHAHPIFLPASRTGFTLLYRTLARQIVGDALIKTDRDRAPVPDLTRPAVDFVDLLLGLRPEAGGAYPDEAAFLERALGGRILLRSDIGLPEVLYEHTAGEPPLPMQLSSSLVTELAPVVLTLRHVYGYRVLIIEEPEAHLHPKLQRILAQVIVRLIRKGLFVWITTHSDNFCQQINNFMTLGAHPRRAEMQRKHGYEANDYLDVDDVGGYQFELDASGRRTVVTEMKKTPQGLVMPTFNRELAALTDEILDLSEDEA